jgi:hypothetical protein
MEDLMWIEPILRIILDSEVRAKINLSLIKSKSMPSGVLTGDYLDFRGIELDPRSLPKLQSEIQNFYRFGNEYAEPLISEFVPVGKGKIGQMLIYGKITIPDREKDYIFWEGDKGYLFNQARQVSPVRLLKLQSTYDNLKTWNT